MPVELIQQVARFASLQRENFRVQTSGDMAPQEIIREVLKRTDRQLGKRSGIYTLRSVFIQALGGDSWQVTLEWDRDECLAESHEAMLRELDLERPG